MREFICNQKLLKILDEIEKELGHKIIAESMPVGHRHRAKCSIDTQGDKSIFYYIEDDPRQEILCHELMHIVLYFEGYPKFPLANPLLDSDDFCMTVIRLLSMLVLHIEVWKLTDSLGFNEQMCYDNSELLDQIEKPINLQKYPGNPVVIAGYAAYIASDLLCPASMEIKNRLRTIAKQTMPEALDIADSFCRIFETYAPISPESCVSALQDIFDMIRCPKKYLQTVFYDHICSDFRSRLIAL
jgi:hypothetical protein